MNSLPNAVRVVEVGPRDGLQNEDGVIDTSVKLAFVNALTRSGERDIEVASFVNPKAVPQMADGAEVLVGIERREGVRYSALVPNLKGLELWLQATKAIPVRSRGIALFTAASETFNRRNTNAGIEESLETFAAIAERLRHEFPSERPFLRAYISTAVRCPYEGAVSPPKVADITKRLFEIGVDEVSLGDTIGAATPADIEKLLDAVLEVAPVERIALHLHDTRGTALANVLAALGRGIRIFDASAAGLGGCPFAPGASGNLATEDLVYMLSGMRIETGISLEGVAAASEIIRPHIGHQLPSKELQALISAGF